LSQEKRRLEAETSTLKRDIILTFPEILSSRYGKDEYLKMDSRIKQDIEKAIQYLNMIIERDYS